MSKINNKLKEELKQFKVSYKLISIIIIVILVVAIGCLSFYLVKYKESCDNQIAERNDIIENLRTQNSDLREEYSSLSTAKEVEEYYKNYYVGELEDDLSTAVAKAYVAATNDKYGEYYTKEEWAEFSAELDGESYGIGVYVQWKNNCLTVLDAYEDASAYEVGIRPGDIIVGTDTVDFSTMEYEAILKLIKGEKGTTVKLRIKRGEEEFVVEPTRNDFEVKTVRLTYYTENDKKIAHVKITNFYNNTTADFKAALEKIKEDNCDGIIFDVRDNGGGTLSSVTQMLDYLLPEGVIVHINYKNSADNQDITSDASVIIDGIPMVVLINSSTASAAELFTSSLRDYDKVTVIGTTSYGKGCGQTMYYLKDGSVVKLTTFYYDPPKSDNYDGIGIVPDYEVQIADEYKETSLYLLDSQNDAQLQKALEELTK